LNRFLIQGWESTDSNPVNSRETIMAKSTKAQLSHFNKSGHANMVDVSAKPATRREASASAFVELSRKVLAALPSNPKGDPLEVARLAGIQAALKVSPRTQAFAFSTACLPAPRPRIIRQEHTRDERPRDQHRLAREGAAHVRL
jgi:hypothetical protein